MSVAVIQGAGGALGSNFARHLLRQTNLSIVATSRDPSAAKRAILEGADGKLDESRLKLVEVDGKIEDTIKRAAREVEQEFGEKSLRLLINASGVGSPSRHRPPCDADANGLRRFQLHADKSVAEVNYDKLLESFQLNTFAHLLAFKHFYPLLPQKSDIRSTKADSDEQDPANGLVQPGLGVLASLTARIGSIGDNHKGGWMGYRASKAAANQVVATLQRELSLRSTPSIAVALHPGTVVGTNLSKPWTNESDAGKKAGVFTAEVSTSKLLDVIKGLKGSDGGKFLDYAGKEIVW
ncbi:SPOSA6832_01621 [Sporobolomyces salmonicolor]|uniref:SPOSA6832_01621-mRNA-1:cds n=1 Tax=Sporidiobolus salmonicolor TaxID=5005 RepID=A0A0D6EK87_SPOSA|nr:SPOSA6832_01621 [Sporobolomyces salmonicolor]